MNQPLYRFEEKGLWLPVEGPLPLVHATWNALAENQYGKSLRACDWAEVTQLQIRDEPFFSYSDMAKLLAGEEPRWMPTCLRCIAMVDWRLENPVELPWATVQVSRIAADSWEFSFRHNDGRLRLLKAEDILHLPAAMILTGIGVGKNRSFWTRHRNTDNVEVLLGGLHYTAAR